jgi:hypothetical protein
MQIPADAGLAVAAAGAAPAAAGNASERHVPAPKVAAGTIRRPAKRAREEVRFSSMPGWVHVCC